MQQLNRIKNFATIFLVVISIALAQLPIQAQRSRSKPSSSRSSSKPTTKPPSNRTEQNKDPQVPPEVAAALNVAPNQRVKLIRSPKSQAMAKAFDDGSLPEPMRLPPGNIEEQAATLAKAVAKGDDMSVAALHAAILASGYGVRDVDGSVLETTDRGQGMAFQAWEIAAVAKLYGEGYGVGLAHLGEALTRNTKSFKDVTLTTAIIEGIRKGANSEHPAVRYWARFVAELGRNAAEPYDLIGQVDPAKVRLDAVQVFFVLSRLMGDLAVSSGVARHPQQLPYPPTHSTNKGVTTFNHARVGKRTTVETASGPCAPEGWESILRDGGALAATSLYDHILSQQNKSLGPVNLVLTLLKFVLTYAFLEREIFIQRVLIDKLKVTVIPGGPLVRTKTTTAGDWVSVGAYVWIDNKLQELNCQRTFFNSMGLDFSLPNSGPVEGARVAWEGLVGFPEEDRGGLTSAIDYIRNLGEVPRPGEPIVTFDKSRGPRTERYTDRNGKSHIAVIGLPQKKDLSHQKLTEVNKVAGVMFRVQLKAIPRELNDVQGIASTIGDAAGPVIAFLQGDWWGGAASLATEAAYRMAWRGSEPLFFVVKDWEPCEGWSGTISVKGEFKETKDRPMSGGWNLSRTEETTKNYDVRFTLGPVKDTSEGFQNGYFANLLATIEDSYVTVEKRKQVGFCDTGRRNANGSKITEKVSAVLTVTNRQERVGGGNTGTTIYIAERGAAGFNILINSPPQPITGVRRSVMQYEIPQCPLWERVNSHRDERPESFYLPQLEFLATFDPEHPGALKGSKTVKDAGGRPVTYEWDLQKCR